VALRAPQHARHAAPAETSSVEGNARMTGSLAAIIFVLLAVEGLTIVRISSLLGLHVFVGTLLIAPVLYKIGTTGWRFVKYYRGDPAYRRKGPPALLLRLLGPVVVVLTVAVLASGVGLVVLSRSWRSELLAVHQASFLLWFAAMSIHVLGHLGDTMRLAPLDWVARTRRQVKGASARQWALATSVALGVVAALVVTPYANGWFQHL
jgi:hypothetical protein